MLSTRSGVLKRDKAKVAGQRLLARPASTGRPAENAQARIVERDDEHAIIEVRCGCGRVIQLNCTFADSPQPPSDA